MQFGPKRRRLTRGGSLIEILTVIVVFLVGILAVVQVFPPGLNVLRTTRAQTQAASLAKAEAQRVLGQSVQLPEMVAAASFNGTLVQILPSSDPNELNPPPDNPAAGTGLVDQNGNVLIGVTNVGHWTKLSGPNRFNRVIGEGRPVPQPTNINGELAGVMNLMFAPIYHVYNNATNTTQGNVLTVYGNDLESRTGATDDGIPAPAETNYPTYTFTFVPASKATNAANTPFPNEDQIWIGRLYDSASLSLLRHGHRISLSFTYDIGAGNVRNIEAIATVPGVVDAVNNPAYQEFGNYAVISVPRILDTPPTVYTSANYRGVESASLRVQRMYREVPRATAFNAADPYEYKAYNRALGTLLFNPSGAATKVQTSDGVSVALLARADYSVYDWRIIRDEFQIPDTTTVGNMNPTVKLVLNSIQSSNSAAADNSIYPGIAVPADSFMFTPDVAGTLASQDFVLMDMGTGGIIAGNTLANAGTSYVVEKRDGSIRFIDSDTTDAFPITGTEWLPGATPADPWIQSLPMDLSGRKVKAMYIGRGSYAVQMYKAAASYKVVYPAAPADLAAGQCTPGGSNGWGQTNRLYFPLADSGQKVTIGDLRTNSVVSPITRDRDFKLSGRETIAGVTLAYAEMPGDFDFAPTGYAVRRVAGASLKMRAFWNPQTFLLNGDQARNFEEVKRWTQTWHKVETETFDAGRSN